MNYLKDICIIVPIYNEQELLDELFLRLISSVSSITSSYEIIFVNDGSTDNSLAILKRLSEKSKEVYYINFSRNFGHQLAISAGLKHCKAKSVVIIDGDLQDPPELIPELYQTYKKGFDVVYAQRKKRDGETYLKKITSKWFYKVLENITNFSIPLDTGDFRIIDKKVVDALNLMPEQNKFLRAQIAWLGFNQSVVMFDRAGRKAGKSGYSYAKLIRMALDGITGFSDKPLLFVSRLGLIISIVSFAIIIFALFSYIFLDQIVTGWTSLIISSSFIGGIQLLSIGVIGEYISRISTDVKKRPLYIVSETNIVKTKKEPLSTL